MPKRKRQTNQSVKKAEAVEDGQDIVGGLKDPTGNTRSAGSTAQDTDQITHFKVPFTDKQIVCERHHPTYSRSKQSKKVAPLSFVFTHGAGGGIENPATKDFVTGFATSSEHDAICFQGTMNLSHRTKTFHAVLENQGRARALGGRSMGSRAAVITATECEEDMRPDAVVLVSYPLTSESGKTKKGTEDGEADPRKQIMLDLPQTVDVLFVIGSEDKMCSVAALKDVREQMTANSWLIEVKGADHGMSLKPKAGVQPMRLRTGALAAEWLHKRDTNATMFSISWDKEANETLESGWYAPKEAIDAKATKSSTTKEATAKAKAVPAKKKRKK